jgi:hypothetical protein
MTNPQVPPEPPRAPDVSPKPEPSPVVKPEPKPVERATTPVPRTTVPFTKMAAAWWALIVGTLVLIVFLIFIGAPRRRTCGTPPRLVRRADRLKPGRNQRRNDLTRPVGRRILARGQPVTEVDARGDDREFEVGQRHVERPVFETPS